MDFSLLPYNTDRVYVIGVDKSGTKVYVPIRDLGTVYQQSAREELQEYLDTQPAPARVRKK